MKTMLILQITVFILCAGIFGGFVVTEGVYENVRDTIVNVLCLSCLKLNTATDLNFTFITANDEEHPSFILENLSEGVVFLAFREDVCTACDIMEPSVQEIFDVHFKKEDTVVVTKTMNDVDITLIHISINHSPQYLIDLYSVYDQYHIGGVPMFTAITYGYDRGTIKPYYTTGYGTLKAETSEEQILALQSLIDDAVLLYKQNHNGGD